MSVPSSLPRKQPPRPQTLERPWLNCHHAPSLRGNPLRVLGRIVCAKCATEYLIAKEAGLL